MKKILNILSAITLASVGTSSAIACKDNTIAKKDENNKENKNEEENAVKKFNDISLAQDSINKSIWKLISVNSYISANDNSIYYYENSMLYISNKINVETFYYDYWGIIRNAIGREVQYDFTDFKMIKILKADKVTIATKEDFHTGGTFFVKFNGIGRLTGTVIVGFEIEKLQKIQLDVSKTGTMLNQTNNFNMTYHRADTELELTLELVKQKWDYYLKNEEWIVNFLKNSISPEWAINSNLVIGEILKADKVTIATKEDLQEWGGIFFVEFNGINFLKGTMLIKFEMKFFKEPPRLTKDMHYSYLIINRK